MTIYGRPMSVPRMLRARMLPCPRPCAPLPAAKSIDGVHDAQIGVLGQARCVRGSLPQWLRATCECVSHCVGRGDLREHAMPGRCALACRFSGVLAGLWRLHWQLAASLRCVEAECSRALHLRCMSWHLLAPGCICIARLQSCTRLMHFNLHSPYS